MMRSDSGSRQAELANPPTPGRLDRLHPEPDQPQDRHFFSSIFVVLLPVDTPLWVRLAALGIVAFQETWWYALVTCLLSHRRVQAAYQRISRTVDQDSMRMSIYQLTVPTFTQVIIAGKQRVLFVKNTLDLRQIKIYTMVYILLGGWLCRMSQKSS